MKQTSTLIPNSNRMPVMKSSQSKTVAIEYDAAEAGEVFIAGDFNEWNPRRTRMRKDARGVWKKQLWLSPGGHEYRLVVDGQWRTDPHAPASIANPYGGSNSFMQVE